MTDYQHSDSYIVWRRSDGHVSATTGKKLPSGWRYRDHGTGELVEVTFEELLVTDDWPAAHARIRAERVADEMLKEA
jgi:hypothetical protein